MPRYRITVEYDGGEFVGWQRQASDQSVQGTLEAGLEKLTGGFVLVQGAGRTDSGVHATGQVAHFDLPKPYTLKAIRDGVNFHVRPAAVGILDAVEVPETFNARFSAISRSYRYRILNRRGPPVMDRGHVWFVPQPLDIPAMQAAAKRLLGCHDFTSFRAAQCQANSPIRTMDELTVTRHGDEVWVEAKARSFLHKQIRITVGTLMRVAEGAWTPDDVTQALEAKRRDAAGQTAPPEGLCLTGVGYP
ncbi:MAG: tRNA pseudouridine(38-40) synthase TruA [Alphaproteobacteria bacterium]